MPLDARVWIFISNSILNKNQVDALDRDLQLFVADWTTHGKELSAGFELLHQSVVVIAVDESKTPPSGCSIDKVFRLLQDFGAKENLDFFQRTSVALVGESGVRILNKKDATLAFENGDILPQQICINSLVNTIQLYNQSFMIPFSEHWLGRQLIPHADK